MEDIYQDGLNVAAKFNASLILDFYFIFTIDLIYSEYLRGLPTETHAKGLSSSKIKHIWT